MNRSRWAVVIAAAVVAAGGAGTAAALTTGGTAAPGPPVTGSPATGSPAAGSGNSAGYSYYQSVMGRLYGGQSSGGPMGGPMMGGPAGGSSGSYGWMMGRAGYSWMMGGSTAAPGWMRRGTLPGSMMSGGGDPGAVMGKLWADAPGPRVSPAQAARLATQVPAGAAVDRARHRVTFHRSQISLTAVASAPNTRMYSFEIAGMVNPAVIVPAGAHVSIEVVNADGDMAHGLVITTGGAVAAWMPMMSAAPAFPGAAAWFLGTPTAGGMHAATFGFTATTAGSYQYLCPVPGHAVKGMAGTFTVSAAA